MAAKKRNMTNKEKQHAKAFREELRKEGILPPIKPKLNRSKFAKEVHEQWQEHGDIFYLSEALAWMIPSGNFKSNITLEQVGALKVMKLAVALKQFEGELKAEGKTNYNAMDMYKNVVEPIVKL